MIFLAAMNSNYFSCAEIQNTFSDKAMFCDTKILSSPRRTRDETHWSAANENSAWALTNLIQTAELCQQTEKPIMEWRFFVGSRNRDLRQQAFGLSSNKAERILIHTPMQIERTGSACPNYAIRVLWIEITDDREEQNTSLPGSSNVATSHSPSPKLCVNWVQLTSRRKFLFRQQHVLMRNSNKKSEKFTVWAQGKNVFVSAEGSRVEWNFLYSAGRRNNKDQK